MGIYPLPYGVRLRRRQKMNKKTKVSLTPVSLTHRLAVVCIALAVLFTILLVTGCKTGADPNSKTYDVTIKPNSDGEITSNPKKAAAGKTVTVTVKPNEGKALKTLEIDAKSDGSTVEAEVVNNEDGSSAYTFKMPSGGVFVTATFIDTYIFAITISADIEHGQVTSKLKEQYSGYAVTLILTPDKGYRYHPGSLKVTALFEDAEDLNPEEISPTEAVFIMPQAPVIVYAAFSDENIPLYDIVIDPPPTRGKIKGISHAAAGDKVYLDLEPDSGYRYKPDSLVADGITFTEEASASGGGGPNGNRRFSFTMPASNITLSATFELVPTYDVTLTKNGFGQNAVFAGVPIVGGKGGEGDKITLYLDITNTADYRYEQGSFTISDNVTDLVERVPGHEWTFTMPAGAVTAAVNIIEVDKTKPLNTVKAGTLTGGTMSFMNLDDGKAREGDTVTVVVEANSGQVINLTPATPGPTSTPSVVFTKIEDDTTTDTRGRWYFTMPGQPITVNITFRTDSSTYKVTASPDIQNGKLNFNGLDGRQEARVGASVSVTAIADTHYEPVGEPYVDGYPDIKFTRASGSGYVWTFTMPKTAVVVSMDFTKTTFKVEKGIITTGGDISFGGTGYISATGEAQKGSSVTITATPENGYKTQGNPAVDVEGVNVSGNGPWAFTMPEQDVKVSMSFELVTYNISVAGNIQNGTLTVGNTLNNITAASATAKMGDTVYVQATPLAQYRIAANNIPTATGISFKQESAGIWSFIMPAGNVTTLSMTFTRITYTVSQGGITGSGSITIGGLTNGEAPMGAPITITAVPGFGVGADTPTVKWNDGSPREEQPNKISKNNWTFTMKGYPVTIDVVFAAGFLSNGNVKIYSNGAFIEPGLSLAPEYYWTGSPNADSQANITAGNITTQFNVANTTNANGGPVALHDGHEKAIRIKGATRSSGDRLPLGFSLVKTAGPKVDLSGTSGLSFMLYYPGNGTNSWYPIKWIGFGDVNSDSKSLMHMGPGNNANFMWGNDNEHAESAVEYMAPGWHRVIVPVPKVSDNFEVSNVFNIRVELGTFGHDEYFLIDDIEFLEGDALALTEILIRGDYTPENANSFNAADIVRYQVGETKMIRFKYTTVSSSITPAISSYIFSENINVGIGGQQTFAPWGLANDYVFQVLSGTASVSGSGGSATVTPGSGTSRLVLKIGNNATSNEMTINP